MTSDQRNRKIWMDNPIATDRNSSGHTMNWVYDAVGNKLRETRADGTFRSWDYDSMNQLWRAYDSRTNDPPASYQTTTYTRDLAGNAVSIKDSKGAIYGFSHDALSRKTGATYPIDATSVARTEHFWYDIAGNLAKYKNPAGQYKHLDLSDSYDSRNRLRHAGWNLSSTSATPAWNIGPETTTEYDAASRMTKITTNGGETTVAFGYDNANRKIVEDQTLAGLPTRRVNTPRDDDGNRVSLTAPSYSVTYAYTGRNQLAAVNGFASFTYDKSGNMTNRVGQWLYPNGANFYYDSMNRVTEIEQRNATAIFADSHYQYDKVGREVATWRDEDGNKGERFSYNATDNLTSALYMATNVWTTTPAAPQTQRQYTHDADQLNWSSITDNGIVKPFVNNALNQYTSVNGQALTHDNNFNIASYAGKSFIYDAQNQLVSGSLQATYDGLGRCVKRTINGAVLLFTYDDWKPILEWNGAGGWVATNVYGAGPDEILARQDSTGRKLIYKQDQHGNVVAVLDAVGNVAEKYTYDAYGLPRILSGTTTLTASAIGKPFMFTGRQWIAEAGIYDYRRRMYHPGLGRFLQTDPIGLQTEGEKLTLGQKALFSSGGQAPEAFGSSEMNLFRYCGNDPINKTDPTGLLVNADDDTTKMMDDLRNKNDNLRSAVDQLRGSDKVHDFKSAEDTKNAAARGPNGLKGNHSEPHRSFGDWLRHLFGPYNKSGSTTYFNPRNNQDVKGVFRDARSQLAHEIGHALDYDNGTTSDAPIGNLHTPTSETRGIWWENEANRSLGLDQRGWNDWGRLGP